MHIKRRLTPILLLPLFCLTACGSPSAPATIAPSSQPVPKAPSVEPTLTDFANSVYPGYVTPTNVPPLMSPIPTTPPGPLPEFGTPFPPGYTPEPTTTSSP